MEPLLLLLELSPMESPHMFSVNEFVVFSNVEMDLASHQWRQTL